MNVSNGKIVTGYAKMWPRIVFDMKAGNKDAKELLQNPGVYVLYRDDMPYYVGKNCQRTLAQNLGACESTQGSILQLLELLLCF